MGFASRGRAPRTLTDSERQALLRVTGEHARGFRDHMLFAMALGTGLREAELCALSIDDVTNAKGAPRARVTLRVFKRCTDNTVPQQVFVSDALRKKLGKFLRWKKRRGESLEPEAPLFAARGGNQLSTRRAREAFAQWRRKSDLSDGLTFHALRHTFCQRLYKQTGDLRLVQVAARHASITTTTIYTEPSADDVAKAIGELD